MNKLPAKGLLLIAFAILSGSAMAAGVPDPVEIDSSFRYVMLGREVRYLKVRRDDLKKADDVFRLDDSAFTPMDKPGFFFGLEESSIWLKFDAKFRIPPDKEATSYLIELANPYLDSLSCFIYEGEDRIFTKRLGPEALAGASHHRNWQIKLDTVSISPEDSLTFLLYIPASKTPLQFDLYLWEKGARAWQQNVENLVLVASFTVLLFFLALICIANRVIRFSSLWYYAIYVALGALFIFSDLGLGYQYLWPGWPGFRQPSNLLFANLYLLAGLQFVRTYFRVAYYFPNINKGMVIVMGVATALIPFTLAVPLIERIRFTHILSLLHYLVFLAGSGLVAGVFAYSAIRRQKIMAGWFLIGFGLHGLAILLTIMQYVGLLPTISFTRFLANQGHPMTFFTQVLMIIGALVEAPILFYIAFVRFKGLYDHNVNQARELANWRENHWDALMMGIESERKRVGQDLHDSLGVQLAAAKMRLSLIAEASANGQKDQLRQVSKDLENAHGDLRRISHNLMPRSLEKLGLEAAIKEDLNRMEVAQPGLKTHFYTNIPLNRLKLVPRWSLYRIMLELFTNVVQHAGATELNVQIVGTNDHNLLVTVEDNGAGFDLKKMNGKGIGIKNIENRVNLLGGRFDLDSSPGRGTIASLEAPLIPLLEPEVKDI
ncbi:MAG TPA: 7TM diverse intracellular signaling domain-containing protein [Flavilitoribacter sp.]|nr:7TM diverse intracellular signaling domain-containing protein [Flavilitoribacter sp.]